MFPDGGPTFGDTRLTLGTDTYVYRSAAAFKLFPPRVVTRTSTVPVPGGAVTRTVVGEITATDVAGLLPKSTEEEAVNPVPIISIVLPPLPGPKGAKRAVTAGRGGGFSCTHFIVSKRPSRGGGTINGGVVTTLPLGAAGEEH